jgi:hypothetical protein
VKPLSNNIFSNFLAVTRYIFTQNFFGLAPPRMAALLRKFCAFMAPNTSCTQPLRVPQPYPFIGNTGKRLLLFLLLRNNGTETIELWTFLRSIIFPVNKFPHGGGRDIRVSASGTVCGLKARILGKKYA